MQLNFIGGKSAVALVIRNNLWEDEKALETLYHNGVTRVQIKEALNKKGITVEEFMEKV